MTDLAKAELVGIILETLFFGVFLVLFPLALNALLVRRHSADRVGLGRKHGFEEGEIELESFWNLPRFNKVMLIVSVTLFFSISGVWIHHLNS